MVKTKEGSRTLSRFTKHRPTVLGNGYFAFFTPWGGAPDVVGNRLRIRPYGARRYGACSWVLH